jgi:hypothetical protein
MAHDLPCRSLPCRSLPCRALSLIREYSRPLTRPDWRKSKPIITTYKLLLEICSNKKENRRRMRLLKTILKNIKKTNWFWIYNHIKYFGLRDFYIMYYEKYGVKYYNRNNICKIDGIEFAIQYYTSHNTHISPIPQHKWFKLKPK